MLPLSYHICRLKLIGRFRILSLKEYCSGADRKKRAAEEYGYIDRDILQTSINNVKASLGEVLINNDSIINIFLSQYYVDVLEYYQQYINGLFFQDLGLHLNIEEMPEDEPLKSEMHFPAWAIGLIVAGILLAILIVIAILILYKVTKGKHENNGSEENEDNGHMHRSYRPNTR